jgi:hypothetical protein
MYAAWFRVVRPKEEEHTRMLSQFHDAEAVEPT